MLLISMESDPIGLGGRLRSQIAKKSLSGPNYEKISAQVSGGLFPEHEHFGSYAPPLLDIEWRPRGSMSLARRLLAREMDRLDFDASMLEDIDPIDAAVVHAEIVLWLASHSRVVLGKDLSLAALYGPSAVGSLSAILARAVGHPVEPGTGSPLTREEKRLMVVEYPRMPTSASSFWMPSWAVGLAEQALCAQAHAGHCESYGPLGACRQDFWESLFVPAVATDFSHKATDGSASARSRVAVMIRSGALSPVRS